MSAKLSLSLFLLTVQHITAQTFCPSAFQPVGAGCYFYGYFKLNWFRAMEFCHSLGKDASLVVIETEEENRDLKSWLTVHGDPNTGVWVGGSDNGHRGLWSWFPTGHLIKYFDWGLGQPSGGDQHCLYVVGGWLGYQWADFHCDFQMTFLCEFNIRKRSVWDLPMNKVLKFRPNSKQSNKFSPPVRTQLKLLDLVAETENEQEELEVSQVEELEDQQPMILQDTIKFDDDFTEVVDTDTSPDKAKKEPGSASEPTPSTLISDGSSWAILEIIKTVIQIAFNN